VYFRVNYTEDGKKYGECSLFNSLEFPTSESMTTYESKIPNSLPLVINNVITANDKPLNLKENTTVCSSFLLLYIFNIICLEFYLCKVPRIFFIVPFQEKIPLSLIDLKYNFIFIRDYEKVHSVNDSIVEIMTI